MARKSGSSGFGGEMLTGKNVYHTEQARYNAMIAKAIVTGDALKLIQDSVRGGTDKK